MNKSMRKMAAVLFAAILAVSAFPMQVQAMSLGLTQRNSGKLLASALFGDDAFIEKMNAVISEDSVTAVSGDSIYRWSSASEDSLAEALADVKNGGTLCIAAGTYKLGADGASCINLSGFHGTPEHYVNIMPEPGAVVTFDGSSASHGDELSCFYLEGASYIRISGIRITGFRAKKSVRAFDIEGGCSHVIIDGCEIAGIRVASPKTADHCGNAILCYNTSTEPQTDILLADNLIHDCATGWSEAISVDGNNKNINIINNDIRRTGNIGIDLAGNYPDCCPDAAQNYTRSAVAAGNYVCGEFSPYGDTSYGIYADGAHDSVIENNAVTGCDGGIEIGAEQSAGTGVTDNITVRCNLICNNKSNEFTAGGWQNASGTVTDVRVTNNTIVNEKGFGREAVITLSRLNGITFANNIITSVSGENFINRTAGLTVSSAVFTDNLYCGGTEASDTMAKNAGSINDVFINPLNHDYTLNGSSSAINAGISADFGTYDLQGNARCLGTVDLGAYEYQSEPSESAIPRSDGTNRACGTVDLSGNGKAVLSSVRYTGRAIRAAASVSYAGTPLRYGRDYSVKYVNCRNAGTATVIFTGKGSRYGALSRTAEFQIQPADITDDGSTAAIKAHIFTGSEICPKLLVRCTSLKKNLRQGRDYEAVFKNNVHSGYASVTVSGMGNYTGVMSVQFLIVPRKLSDGKIRISGITAQKSAGGTVILPDLCLRLGKMTLSEGTDYTVTYEGNTAPGTAYVNILAHGNDFTGRCRRRSFRIIQTVQASVSSDVMMSGDNILSLSDEPVTEQADEVSSESCTSSVISGN